MVDRLPRHLLRLEGLALFAGCLVLYGHLDFDWVVFLVLFLAPDVSAVGFLAGGRAGAISYDLVHTLAGPVVLGAAGVAVDARVAVQLALIWAAHIGFDRAVGYGLRYPASPRETHLDRV